MYIMTLSQPDTETVSVMALMLKVITYIECYEKFTGQQEVKQNLATKYPRKICYE